MNDAITLRCDFCGESFERARRRTGRYARAYCSKRCSNRANARSGEANSNYKEPIELVCPVCSATFTKVPSLVSPKWNCCSHECDSEYRRRLTGAARYNFKGPSKLMTCEVCSTQKLVRYPMQKRFRACSRRCAGILGNRAWPRSSSLEVRMAEAFARAGLVPVAQYPLDRATADFAFPASKLIIECDGSYWHSLPEVRRRDQRRDGWLRSRGWRILRFDESAIRADADACVEQVQRWLSLHKL